MASTDKPKFVHGFWKGEISAYDTPRQIAKLFRNGSSDDLGHGGGDDDDDIDDDHDRRYYLHSTCSLVEMLGKTDHREVDVFEDTDESGESCAKTDDTSLLLGVGRRDPGPNRPPMSLLTASLLNASATGRPLGGGRPRSDEMDPRLEASHGSQPGHVRRSISKTPSLKTDLAQHLALARGHDRPYMEKHKSCSDDDATARLLRDMVPRW